VVVLSGDVPEDLTADRVKLAVAPEEAHHPFGLLKGLDSSVEQKAIEAAIVKSDVTLMVLVKGVHGFLPRCEILRKIHPGRLLQHHSYLSARPSGLLTAYC
jgi:hypothetical protein